MKIKLQKQLTAFVLLLLSFLFFGCDKDKPTGPGGTIIPDAPFGMLNWNDTSHAWARNVDDNCAQYYNAGNTWEPKFSFRIMDVSPDGGKIILGTPRNVLAFDTASRTIATIFPFACADADWSRNGKHIAAITDGSRPSDKQIVIYSVADNTWSYLPVPDSIGFINLILHWLPNDTALLIAPNFSNIRGFASIGVSPPFAVVPFNSPNLGTVFSEHEAFNIVNTYPSPDVAKADKVDLRVGAVGDTVGWRIYPLSRIYRAVGLRRLSSDNNWLAFSFDADVSGTSISTGSAIQDYLPCLGVIDLRPGSPTQYQLYRVFADYTEGFKNCSWVWYLSGVAISGNGKYLYHERIRRSDSTLQIVRRDVRTGRVEELTNFLSAP